MDLKLLDSGDREALPVDPTPKTTPSITPNRLSIELEDGGEAVFRIPTVADLKAVEKVSGLAITDTCRELAARCVISWGDRASAPDEDDIYAADDQALVRLMLMQLAGADDASLSDEDLMKAYLGQVEGDRLYEVLPDKRHKVTLAIGELTLRRLTRKDIRRIEANASKVGAITGDVLAAVSICEEWWRSDRAIMPADFDAVPLAEFRRVSAALQGFLKRSAGT